MRDLILIVALVLAVLLQAAVVNHAWNLERLAMLSGPDSFRDVMIASIALGAAWLAMLAGILRGGVAARRAAGLARPVGWGALIAGAVLLILGGILRYPGTPLTDLILLSLPAHFLVVAAASRPVSPWTVVERYRPLLGLALLAAGVASFTLTWRAFAASNRVTRTEQAAIDDLRTILEAEARFESTTGAGFASLECLVTPMSCLSTYREKTAFLDGSLLRPARRGYRFEFHAGARSTRGGLASYIVTAEPVAVGVTGVRAFCADSGGVVWQTLTPSLGPTTGAGCPTGMNQIQ